MIKVVGIDPGIERLGWGVLIKKENGIIARVDSGVNRTPKTDRTSKRLLAIQQFLDELMKKEKPDLVSVEKLFFSKNVKTAMIIGEVRGVILATIEKHNISLVEFTPMQVKAAVAGNGNADKAEVASMLKLSITLPPKKLLDDETDALALALTGLVYKKFG